MRYVTIVIGVIILFLFGFTLSNQVSVAQTPAVQEEKPNISFEWAFGAFVGKDKNFVSVTHDTSLKSGEEVKMMVKLHRECFVYLVYYGSHGEVQLLFPSSVKQFQTDYELEKNYYIPTGRDWSKLDKNTGKEKFYLVASSERLLDLEAKIGDYSALTDEMKKKSMADSIVAEIRNVRKRFASFATITEKPLTIGGNVRALQETKEIRRPDVADIAIVISAKNFYNKTFTIDHQ